MNLQLNPAMGSSLESIGLSSSTALIHLIHLLRYSTLVRLFII